MSQSRALRLFVALELPEEAVAALSAVPLDEDVWRRVAPESLHVTLAFLGATAPDAVPALRSALEGIAAPAPRLGLGAPLLLPPRRPRVFTIALEDLDGSLAALQRDLAARLTALGAIAPEALRFRPHVTVGRLRPRVRAPRVTDVTLPPLEFRGTAVTLFSSRTLPHGARYEPLLRRLLPAGRIDD